MIDEKCSKCGQLKSRNEPEARICDHEWIEEERYCSVSLMFKTTPDHNWDTLFDLVENWLPPCSDEVCTCGLLSFGGTEGNEEQCWKNQGIHKSIAEVKTDDLKVALFWFNEHGFPNKEAADAYERLYKEAYWWDELDEQFPDDEEEEADYVLPEEYLPYFSNEVPDLPGWEDDGGH